MNYSITLYGTKKVGFTYLLGRDGAGLVPTSGPGSDYGVKNADRGTTVPTIDAAVEAALTFLPAGAKVKVHAPGTGRVLRTVTLPMTWNVDPDELAAWRL